jgi:hypothetical protein
MGRGVYDPSLTEAFGTKKDGPNLVEGCPFISAKEIPRDGPPRTTWAGLPLTTTIPRFGGLRYYFLCPRCRRRVGKLYDVRGWACRRCHRLTYQSQHVSLSTNPLLRSLQLIARLDALEARYKAGDTSALKPLRKLVDRMWKEIPRDRASPQPR